ncbi:MAG: sigma 54-interacting transcriptional regulator [Planctomycetes bacterium]|nr:sigma 54-interacting transcriptional regulator [Planctomycetota bacterium]
MDLNAQKSGVSVSEFPYTDGIRLPTLVCQSRLFRQVLTAVDAVAQNDCIVLLEGESGTGKELLARRIHLRSARRDRPFVPVNCPGISETLFESQLFGYVKGAFTGAAGETLGMVRTADKGTLLLDEIAETPMHLQPKLLRLLQEYEVTPVGACKPIRANVRFIASTNRNLQRLVQDGGFRADLYHRLNIVRIEVPPLRCRVEDIDPLVEYYLRKYAQEYKRSVVQLSEATRRQLRQYGWPGNVRELCAYIERLYATDMVPMPPGAQRWDAERIEGEPVQLPVEPAPGRVTAVDNTPWIYTLAYVEEQAIRRALEYANWNRSAAAKLLDIHRSTLIRKIRIYGIRRAPQPVWM